MGEVRPIAAPFVVLGPPGVAVRDRLKGLTPRDVMVLRLVGDHLGSLAGGDLKARCVAHLANAGHGPYLLDATVSFPHRGEQWRDRVSANRAVAYRICEEATKGRWYLTASWTIPPVKTVPLQTVRAGGPVAIGRRALGHPIRRRTAPPPHDQSDRVGYRTVRAALVAPGRQEPRPRAPGHDPRRPDVERTRATRTPNTVRDVRLSTHNSRSVCRNGSNRGVRSA